jgi:aspartate/tyrosine/aromatic aminotransferase
MFETLPMAPPDPILGLAEAFRRDPNPAKIDLSAGVYRDATGKTPIFRAVKRAEERILRQETSKNYLSIQGSAEYAAVVQELLFGSEHEVLASKRVATVHTPGGTGALRVAGDFLKKMCPGKRIWMSQPTWPNHPSVFQAAGLEVKTYPYFDAATNSLAFDEMIAALRQVPEGDVVLLHACCHNPTGIDPTLEQWSQIADVIEERGLLPLVDFAYQGLGDGLREDAKGLLTLCRPGCELLIASSFSKNFGLYNERVGALTIVASSPAVAEAVLSQVKLCIRANYSNPPAHGAAIVTTIWNDPELRADWEAEVREMRDRIHEMRSLFVETLADKGVQRDFSFIAHQRGMFSFSGLTPEQVEVLRQKYSIYIVSSGRMNVAGMTTENMDRICQAIAEVLQEYPS